MDAVGPEVDIAFAGEITLRPRLCSPVPTVFFSLTTVLADRPFAFSPRMASRASVKSPVEIPFR